VNAASIGASPSYVYKVRCSEIQSNIKNEVCIIITSTNTTLEFLHKIRIIIQLLNFSNEIWKYDIPPSCLSVSWSFHLLSYNLIRVAFTNCRGLNAWFVAFTLLSGVQAGRAERKTPSVSNGRPRIHSAI
jgi:hypothetical protein